MKFTRAPIRASRHRFSSTEGTQDLNAFDRLVTELTHLEKLLEYIQANLDSYPSSLDTGWLEILTPAELVGELAGLNKPKGRGRLREWLGRDRMEMEAQASAAKVERVKSTFSLILAMSQLTMHNMASETKGPADNASSDIQEVYIEPIAQNPGRTKEECPQVLALEEHRREIRSLIDIAKPYSRSFRPPGEAGL